MNTKIKWAKMISFWELVMFFISIGIFLSFILFYFFLSYNYLINKGLKFFKQKDYVSSSHYFYQLLQKDPLDVWSYFNLALNQDKLNNKEQALETYQKPIFLVFPHSKQDLSWMFYSYFNRGELNGRLGRIDVALKSYQNALRFKKHQKKVKTNIELLLKNLNQQPKIDPDKNQQARDEQKNHQQGLNNKDNLNPDKQTEKANRRAKIKTSTKPSFKTTNSKPKRY